MDKVRVAGKVLRVTSDFIETLEYFSDGTFEIAVYYHKSVVDRYF